MTKQHKLQSFVSALTEILEAAPDEPALLAGGTTLLRGLVASDDWLANEFAQPDPDRYRQYLLYCDPRERFSVVSFVWGPGQTTPIHDHRVWGLIGVLRGIEKAERFSLDPSIGLRPEGPAVLLHAGEVDAVGPSIGDIHRVSNALQDQISISIHVYGANIGTVERATYDKQGPPRRFVSGYANF